ARSDYLHKASHHISKNHAVVCIEDLKVANMSRSASGNAQTPGRNVAAKSALNRSIVDQGWGEFRRQLDYKLNWTGGQLIVVPAQYTSQQCSACGHIAKDNRKSQAQFCCVSCGHLQNADTNAAKNIEAAGHAVLACGGDVRPELRSIAAQAAPLKQEPSEASQAIACAP
ncbi:MAG: RNA-guided endonuclease InsQ/TnpB family protein, partial [Granulosicoccus sp.]